LEAALPDRKPYAQLTESERWQWHSEVYAFRRVVLKTPIEEKTSPCDPSGDWFNEGLIRVAAARFHEQFNGPRERRHRTQDEAMQREGRALCNRWARQNGYADMGTALAEGRSYTDVARSFGDLKTMPREQQTRFDARSLGVEVREFTPSSERLAAGRQALIDKGYLDPGADALAVEWEAGDVLSRTANIGG
jgi:hypothetical protein